MLQLAWYIYRWPVFCPFYGCAHWVICCGFWEINFEGYSTEVIFQSFKRHLMTITCRVSIQSYRACHVLGHMPPIIQGTWINLICCNQIKVLCNYFENLFNFENFEHLFNYNFYTTLNIRLVSEQNMFHSWEVGLKGFGTVWICTNTGDIFWGTWRAQTFLVEADHYSYLSL